MAEGKSMDLQPFETMVPVIKSPYSFFEPNYEVGRWSDFSDLNFNWKNQFRNMERQMRDMERQMEEMFYCFRRLNPTESNQTFPSRSMDPSMDFRPRHEGLAVSLKEGDNLQMDMNPYVTDAQGNKKLKLTFDVRQFKPEEITVKTSDQQLMVHAKHQEDGENSKVYREYQRQFMLPTSVKPESLKSVLSPEGVLSIEAPVPEQHSIDVPKERVVPIEHNATKALK